MSAIADHHFHCVWAQLGKWSTIYAKTKSLKRMGRLQSRTQEIAQS